MDVDVASLTEAAALQWGRSTRAPENYMTKKYNVKSLFASMGPEHEGSGKSDHL